MVICFISLGSNLGDRSYYISYAIDKIKGLPFTRVEKVSTLIISPTQGGPNQGMYLNGVIGIETGLSPYQLLSQLQAIESSLGRVRMEINGPRTIDLDILLYGDFCLNEESLTIPHPRILERDFVFKPLEEIAPAVAQKLMKTARKKKITLKRAARG
jgi:2-amino-4-hydroxy-6-hydroxymethyldihydropteridine diphosphokinase